MTKRGIWPVRAMYTLVAVALVISLMITAAPPSTVLADAHNDVKAEWDRVDTPTTEGWVLAPGSTIIDYALDATGEVAYAIVHQDEDPCPDPTDEDPHGPYFLLKSEDHAATWKGITSGVKKEIEKEHGEDAAIEELIAVATDGNDPDFLAVAAEIGDSVHVFFSADGGETFSQIGGALAAGFDVYTLAVSRVVNDARNLAIGGTAGGFGVIYRATVVNETPTDWVAAHTGDWEDCNAVVAIQFSPNFHADSTVLAVTYHGDDGVFLQSGTWGTSILWNEPAGFEDAVEVSDEAVDLGRFTAGLAVPSDYNGGNPGHRVLWVWVNYEEGIPAEPRSKIWRVDNADPGTAGPMSDIEGGKTWLASISYLGDIDSGKALAGLLSDEYATNGCPKVKVYRNHGISNMIICCIPWRSACKAPTGSGAMVVSYVAGNKAYAVALEDDGAESAWSWTFDDGVNWNQLSLIDTNIDRLSDVAVSPDCNKTYLVSINEQGCDSVWLHAVNLPEAAEYSGHWIRTWNRTLDGKHGILRLNPGETGGHTIYLAEVGGRRVFRDLYEGLGCWTMGTAPMDIADLAVKNATTVYALGENGKVSEGTADEFTITWASEVDTKLSNGWTIEVWGDEILVGGQDGDVAHSPHGTGNFTALPKKIDGRGLITVAFDSYYGANSVIYAAQNIGYQVGDIWMWKLGETTRWINLMARPTAMQLTGDEDLDDEDGISVAYTGLVLDSADGNPRTGPTTGGVLYASYVVEHDGDWYTGVARSLTPLMQVDDCSDCPVEWDYLWVGLRVTPNVERFEAVPNALKICGCLTADSYTRLFAIDSWNPYDMCEGEDGTVWRFIDCYSKVGVDLRNPADGVIVPADPCACINAPFTASWHRVCDACYYQIQFAMDAEFENLVTIRPQPDYDLNRVLGMPAANPTQFIDQHFLPGETYYWRVRAVEAGTGQLIRSWWSQVRKFTVAPALGTGVFLVSPEIGALNQPRTNAAFVWDSTAVFDSYRFVLSENADLSSPVEPEKTVTTHATEYTGTLKWDTTYFWRVTAIKDGAPASVAIGTFRTVAEPPEKDPPPPPPTTPTWVWVLIAIGAVLVIVVIVLIFRTRRV